ncbi:MAG: hypothetical protein ACJA1C_001979 [Crocinitomicaceae bacterium]
MNNELVITNIRFAPILFRELIKTSVTLSCLKKGKGKSTNERFLKHQFRLGETLEVKRCLMKCITTAKNHTGLMLRYIT